MYILGSHKKQSVINLNHFSKFFCYLSILLQRSLYFLSPYVNFTFSSLLIILHRNRLIVVAAYFSLSLVKQYFLRIL